MNEIKISCIIKSSPITSVIAFLVTLVADLRITSVHDLMKGNSHVSLCCDRNQEKSFQPEKWLVETQDGAECFHAFFPVEMASFMFLSEQTQKPCSFLFCEITRRPHRHELWLLLCCQISSEERSRMKIARLSFAKPIGKCYAINAKSRHEKNNL